MRKMKAIAIFVLFIMLLNNFLPLAYAVENTTNIVKEETEEKNETEQTLKEAGTENETEEQETQKNVTSNNELKTIQENEPNLNEGQSAKENETNLNEEQSAKENETNLNEEQSAKENETNLNEEQSSKENENNLEEELEVNENQNNTENEQKEQKNEIEFDVEEKSQLVVKSTETTDPEVNFVSEVLKNYILENYDFNKDGKITASDMAQITSVDLPYIEETINLQGLEYCTSLEYLYVHKGANYNVISNLQKLQKLSVGLVENQDDYNAIIKIPNLKELYLSDVDFTVFDFTQLPIGLAKLEISSCKIESIGAISQFTNLVELSIRWCYGDEEIQGLENITKLQNLKKLELQSLGLKSIEFIEDIKTIETLNVEYNCIETIEFLKNNRTIKNLDISGNEIKTIDFLQNNQTIEILDISYNEIEDIAPITTMGALQNIRFSGNNIQDISILEKSELLENSWSCYQDIKLNEVNIQQGETIEIELPNTIKKCFDSNSSFYVEDSTVENSSWGEEKVAKLNENKTKIVIDTKDLTLGQKMERLSIYGSGLLNGTTIEINYRVCADADKTKEVEFVGDELKAYISENYDVDKDGKITEYDMAQITQLILPYFSNTEENLQGLQYCINLEELSIYNGTNYSVISDLTKIKKLIVNNIENQDDYNAILKLQDLQSIELSNIDFTKYNLYDIAEQIQNLEKLSISSCRIQSFEEIGKFQNITELYISYCYTPDNFNSKVECIEKINDLSKLKNITLDGMRLEDISFLQGNETIEYLSIPNNNIKNIDIILTIKNLKYLIIYGNNISDLSILEGSTLLQNSWEIRQSIETEQLEVFQGEKLEIDVPYIVKQAMDSNSSFYMEGLEIVNKSYQDEKNTKVNDDKTKIIIDATNQEIGEKSEWLQIQGEGLLEGTTIEVSYVVRAKGDKTKEVEFGSDKLKEYLLENNDIDRDGKITQYDMVQIQNICIYEFPIGNLKGLEYAINLESLRFSIEYPQQNSQTIDISQLAQLTKLKSLYLYGNTEDVSVISNLKNLECLELSVSYYNPENINVIENLTNLKYLYLSGGNIKSLDIVKNLTKLECLSIRGNLHDLEDLTPINNLTTLKTLNIYRYEGYTNNQDKILDYSILNNITNLETLSIRDIYSQFDIDNIEEIKTLKNLNLEVNEIINLNEIAKHTTLESLTLQGCKIKDMSFVKTLENLYYLQLKDNLITDITPLEQLKVYTVDLTNNPVNPETEENAQIIEIFKNRTLILTEYSKIQNLEFKYQDFKEKLVKEYDINRDGEISAYEMEKITYLYIDGKLENTEYLTNLQDLYFYQLNLNAEEQKQLINEINELNDNVQIGTINTLNIDIGTFEESNVKYQVDLSEVCPILAEMQNPTSRLYKGNLILETNYNADEDAAELQNGILIINREYIGDVTYCVSASQKSSYNSMYIYLKWHTSTQGDNTKIIDIPDTKLKEKLLNDYDFDKDGKITEYDANNATNIDVGNAGIKSLSGLENFKNLRNIDAWNNEISNIEPLMELQNLKYANLYGNKITDITCLKNRKFKSVSVIGLNGNYIDFSNKSNQTTIYLQEFEKDMKEYQDEYYGNGEALLCSFASSQRYGNPSQQNTEITMDAKIKSKLIQAGADLNKDGKLTAEELNSATHYTYVNDEYKEAIVKSLDLSNLGLTNLSGIEYLTGLKEINLSHNKISNIEPLSHLMNLTKIDLSYNEITDISLLPYYADNSVWPEKDVNLSHNKIVDISCINKWVCSYNTYYCSWQEGGGPNDRLLKLDLSYNQIENINGVKNYLCLAKLNLSNNKIKDISSLKDYDFKLNKFENEDELDEDMEYFIEMLDGFEGIDLSSNYINTTTTANKAAIQVFKNKGVILKLDNQNEELPFKDISKNAWYRGAVQYCYQNKMILGTTDTEFKPDNKLTRGMLITILHRMEGSPNKTGESKFPDVQDPKAYYYTAVKWGTENKIISGYNNGKFGPNNLITREQLAVILSNYCRYKGKYKTTSGDISKFKDGSKVSGFAKAGMQWAVGSGVITGTSQGILNPQGTATRAEAASMLYKYCMNIK